MACPFLRRTAGHKSCVNGGRPESIGTVCVDGYARGFCPAFPLHDEAPDAIEITAAAESKDAVVIRYATERNYLPVAVGESTFDWRIRKWRPPIEDAMIAAHMDTYLAEFELLKNGVRE